MIVYRYGCRPPVEGLRLVDEQMRLAHRYRNLLTEIERARRGAVMATIGADPDVQAAIAIAEASPEGPARKIAWETVKGARRSAAKGLADDLAAINARAKEFGKLARAQCGVYWGTYLVVEQAADAQRTSGEAPRFRRYDQVGRVAVQLQGGLSVADALAGKDTRLRVEAVDLSGERGHNPANPAMRPDSRRGRRAEYRVWLRVGSEGRAPIWTVAQTYRDRPLPPDGVIKWAVLRRDRVGPDFRWSVQFTVDALPARDPKAVADRAGVVALNLGWRMRPDGMRVGYWQDDAGKHGEIVLPKGVLEDLAHVRSIGAIRDRLFNEFRELLAGWLREHADIVPEWMVREAATIAQWRSADRLARLAARWCRDRFSGDEAIMGPHPGCARDRNGVLDCTLHVECWRRKDRHLYAWEAHATANILARRDEMYKCVSAAFARNYGTVVTAKFRLTDIHGRAGLSPQASDGEKVRADNSSSRRHSAAPGTFRLYQQNACRARGTRFLELACADDTQRCADCGVRNDFDAALAIDHRCSACGVTWDQDRNYTANVMLRYAASSPVTPPGGKVLAGGKSVRQQRFSRRRDRADGARATEAAGCSQRASQVPDIVDGDPGAVASLAQEARP